MLPKWLRYTIETLLVNSLVVSTLYQLIVYLANRRFWRQPPPAPAEGVPSISVVVPLHEKTLDTLALLHVMAITGPTNEYELIMVLEDAGAPAFPAATAIAESYTAVARVVSSGPPGAHASPMHDFNAGYEAARGDLIAFVDPNLHMKAELWNAALALLADPSVGAAFAPPLYLEPERSSTSLVHDSNNIQAAVGSPLLPAAIPSQSRRTAISRRRKVSRSATCFATSIFHLAFTNPLFVNQIVAQWH